jgi:DUF4097 and DUF4098 domain-containing protein YvlB
MRTTMNTFVLALAALFALLVSFGCSDVSVNPHTDEFDLGANGTQDVKASEPFQYTIDLASQHTLKVEGINGMVSVESVSGTNQVTISGKKIVGSETYSDAREGLKNLSVIIDELTDELVVRTVQPAFKDGRNYNVNYTVAVPSHLNIDVKNVNGKISGEVSVPLSGIVDMRSENGSIELNVPQSTSAEFSANLVNGKISLQHIELLNRVETSKSLQGIFGGGEGTISLSTTNGNIDVTGF